MSEQHYTIKPLKWESSKHDCGRMAYCAATAFGELDVTPNHVYKQRFNESTRQYVEDEKPTFLGTYSASYCFDEYYDEGHIGREYSTVKAAKQAAWEHWLKRITSDLVPVKGGAK